MKSSRKALVSIVAMTLAASTGSASPVRADERAGAPAGAQAQVRAEAQPDLDKQRKQAEEQGQKSLDQDAITALRATRDALKAITDNKPDDARAALERASGKIDILVGRNPAAALIPVELEVQIVDAAPTDPKAIKALSNAAQNAVSSKDFPTARVVLNALVSEMRVRTYHLPLATYPAALKEAARLLDEKKSQEAAGVLQSTLSTLVVIDRVTPLPLLVARTAIDDAHAEKDKAKAQALLTVAKNELARAKELGYAGNDPEYAALDKAVSDVEKQLKGNQDAESAFTRLKERFAAFFKRQSENEKKLEPPKK